MTKLYDLTAQNVAREAKRYELGVHCGTHCLGGRAILTETTSPDIFAEDVVMATDYESLLARHSEAIRLLREINSYEPISDSDGGFINVCSEIEDFLAAEPKEDRP